MSDYSRQYLILPLDTFPVDLSIFPVLRILCGKMGIRLTMVRCCECIWIWTIDLIRVRTQAPLLLRHCASILDGDLGINDGLFMVLVWNAVRQLGECRLPPCGEIWSHALRLQQWLGIRLCIMGRTKTAAMPTRRSRDLRDSVCLSFLQDWAEECIDDGQILSYKCAVIRQPWCPALRTEPPCFRL